MQNYTFFLYFQTKWQKKLVTQNKCLRITIAQAFFLYGILHSVSLKRPQYY